jgi:hypothetical protein
MVAGLKRDSMAGIAREAGQNSREAARVFHHFYKHARFYTTEDLMQWLASAGMCMWEHRSTLYQSPGALENREAPRDTLDEEAGFVMVVAGKKNE